MAGGPRWGAVPAPTKGEPDDGEANRPYGAAGRGCGDLGDRYRSGARRSRGHRPEARAEHAGRGHLGHRVHRRPAAAARVYQRPGGNRARRRGQHRAAQRAGQLRHRHPRGGAERLHQQPGKPGLDLHRRRVHEPDVERRLPAVRHGARGNPARPARHLVRTQRHRRPGAVRHAQAVARVQRLRQGHGRRIRAGQVRGRGRRRAGSEPVRARIRRHPPQRRLRRQPRARRRHQQRQRLRRPRPAAVADQR